MPFKSREEATQYQREWTKKNRLKRRLANDRWEEKRKDWFKEFKKTLKCCKCDETHPACLHFHHTDPLSKEFTISRGAARWGEKRFLEEVEKCQILCANCHAKFHWSIHFSPVA